uniref:RZ-type domain-containing protein n=1 Tax=Salarias fasciatus TaxID=181472 RepID=A0A672HCA1_SALFA
MDTGQNGNTPEDGSRRPGGADGKQKERKSREKIKSLGNRQSAQGSNGGGDALSWRVRTRSEPGRGGKARGGSARGWGGEVKGNASGRGGSNADGAVGKFATGGGGRGGHGRQDAKRFQMGRNQVHDGAGGDARKVVAAKGVTGGAGAQSLKYPRPMKAPQRSGLGFRSLQELCDKEPSVVAMTLSTHKDFPKVLDQTSMKQDLIELLCRVINKAFQSRTDRSTLQHLAGIIKDSEFLRSSLPHYLVGMGSESNPFLRAQYPQHLDRILALLSEVLSVFPASSVNTVGVAVTLLQVSISSLKASDVDIQPEMEEKAASLHGVIENLQKKSREGTLKSDKAPLPAVDDEPGEGDEKNFKDIPIYPTLEEFHQVQRPFIRRNLTGQRYTNTYIYLDTHFRLLREDFVRPLREGIQQLLQMDGRNDNLLKKHFDDIRVYFNTKIMAPKCTRSGLAYIVKFDIEPLKFVCWENSKRLIYGSLVCLSSDNFESFLFATVSDREPKDLKKGQVEMMFTEESRVRLAHVEENEVFLMVETTAYFEAYRYVLEGLKEQDEEDLPFQRYIVECNKEVAPPAYLRGNDVYDLSFVADRHHEKKMRPFSSLVPAAWPEMKQLGLDESQMKAFQLALTKELAIIQGPPGTGKTYVGLKIAQALLTNRQLWRDPRDSSPMLVVCYTNHALDQFLEGIHGFLGKGIVRVGGRSNSEILQRFTLRELMSSPNFRRTLPAHLQNAFSTVRFYFRINIDVLKVFLSHAHATVKHFVTFQKEQKKKMKKVIRKELGKSSAMTEQEERNVLDVWSLSQQDRWRLYRWVYNYLSLLSSRLYIMQLPFKSFLLSPLKANFVIGMTTTGAAKFRKALQEVRPRLVIVEEAAEVLEAHIITTLSKDCQHLILIGDHQQLRPSATVYDLAKNFNLEMSMFERLVKMELPFVRLDYQHRMRADIARLLTPHIYPELENHPSVLNYEHIKGLEANLFFVEHNHLEEEIKDGKSHQNEHEAKFVVALCRYLLLQGYKPDQITILTTYTGQLHRLRKLMPASEFSGVKVHVVDKYQGEENDIVLLSLVRSNLQGKVGFLSIPNRVCVALSRAKKGLYCIGNSEILGRVNLWGNIFHTLSQHKQIGKALTLCCQNHPDQKAKVSTAEDFKQAPEGGCTKPCLFRLDCGHVCSSVCHPNDQEHKDFKCVKPCQKMLCDQGHQCKLLCYQQCPATCQVKVEKVVPQCQHTQMVPCSQDPDTFSCKDRCEKLLPCGHPCVSPCGKPCNPFCRVKVSLELKCGHTQEDACYYKTHDTKPECRTSCNHLLKCGHTCPGTCGRCNQGRYHVPCSHPCERLLICSHKCRENCTRECPPCQLPCENCCVHSKCMKQCGQACSPCVEPCAWQCQHQSCSKLCHEPCDRPPCTQPCDKTLHCGHPCIGLCGDKCPKKCRVCDRKEVTKIFFGTEDEPDACFIELEDCGHIIEYTAMDTYMKLDDDEAAEGQEVAIKLKECPKCRTPVRKNLRYGSSINKRLAEVEMVKEKINGHQPDVEEHRMLLLNRWQENGNILEDLQELDFMDIKEMLERSSLTRNDLWLLENKLEFLLRVGKLCNIARTDLRSMDGLTPKVFEFLYWLKHQQQRFTDQQVFDLQRELQRLYLLAELEACCKTPFVKKQADIECAVQKIRDALEMPGQFSERDEDRVKEALKELAKKIPLTGLGISEQEKKMIVSAMKMRPGHWHKCPNGHVYLITECGGAMESRKCPDCDATIGGQNHRLDSGNAVATEMDGAQHSAWSEVNNLQNFDQMLFLFIKRK